MSSFFYGYALTQIPGGYLSTKFGGRYVFGIPIFIAAILTLLTPMAADNIWVLMGLRFIEGLSEVCYLMYIIPLDSCISMLSYVNVVVMLYAIKFSTNHVQPHATLY